MELGKQPVRALVLLAILICALLPLRFGDYITLLAFAWVMVVLALSWDIMGGQMGYNSFGNIFFFGVGMYSCAVVQRAMLETSASASEYFTALAVGMLVGALVAVLLAALLGSLILSMRGHYFAICTLGLGIAAGEIASGIDFIGAGSGMVTPLFPDDAGDRETFFYYLFFGLALITMGVLKLVYRGRFGLAINAIRDNEDKAESMGLHTTAYKTVGWSLSAFILGLAGAGVGNMIGFIDPIDVAFAGSTFGVWMILMAILGGKGTLWGPVIGAFIFYATKELFWTYLLGWQRVALGLMIVLTVVFFPTGILGWARERWPAAFGQSVREQRSGGARR